MNCIRTISKINYDTIKLKFCHNLKFCQLTMATCEKCDDYLAVILDLDEKVATLQKQHKRTEKYAQTLKKHVVRSSSSTKEARAEVALLTAQISKLEYNVRRLRKDPDTMTNAELRELRLYHLNMLNDLQRKLQVEKERSASTGKQLQTVKGDQQQKHARIQAELQQQFYTKTIECQRLLQQVHIQDRVLFSVQREKQVLVRYISDQAAQGQGDYSRLSAGQCVICLDIGAVYAHDTCGCLTYCALCRGGIQNYKCPLCRQNNHGLIKIHNMPSS